MEKKKKEKGKEKERGKEKKIKKQRKKKRKKGQLEGFTFFHVLLKDLLECIHLNNCKCLVSSITIKYNDLIAHVG